MSADSWVCSKKGNTSSLSWVGLLSPMSVVWHRKPENVVKAPYLMLTPSPKMSLFGAPGGEIHQELPSWSSGWLQTEPVQSVQGSAQPRLPPRPQDSSLLLYRNNAFVLRYVGKDVCPLLITEQNQKGSQYPTVGGGLHTTEGTGGPRESQAQDLVCSPSTGD